MLEYIFLTSHTIIWSHHFSQISAWKLLFFVDSSLIEVHKDVTITLQKQMLKEHRQKWGEESMWYSVFRVSN